MSRHIALAFALAIGMAASAAQALPLASPPEQAGSGLTLVYGGCGPYGHRGPYGGCRPGGQAGRPLPGGYVLRCPPGYRLGPGGRACWPMRRFYY